MLASELSKLLAEYPDSRVLLNVGKNGLANGRNVRKVELMRVYRYVGMDTYHELYDEDTYTGDDDQEVLTVLNITTS